jgi:HNH endonuclease
MKPWTWTEAIKKRDGYRCVECGSTERINAHHIMSKALGGENELENGKTLCWHCHMEAHKLDRHLWKHPGPKKGPPKPKLSALRISIPIDVHDKALHEAHRQGRTLKYVIDRLFSAWLADDPRVTDIFDESP